MNFKSLFLILVFIFLVGCSRPPEEPVLPTLDATHLNETAVSQVTADFAKTQTALPTETPIPTSTTTPIPTIDRTRPPFQTPSPDVSCNQAQAGHPIDVTIPDDTIMAPGTNFSKTWRLKNVGSCTWTRMYTISFFSGNSLGATYDSYILQPVEPGQMIDITVDMVAPQKSGVYQSNWMLKDADGNLFGIGPHGDAPFWARIEVVPLVTDTPFPTPTATITPAVYVQGEAELASGDRYDLDSATLNPTDHLMHDLVYTFDSGSSVHTLMNVNESRWAVFGENQPSLAACSAVDLDDTPIEFTEVPVGTFVCYRTSGGLPGRLMIRGYEAERLMISFLTWSIP